MTADRNAGDAAAHEQLALWPVTAPGAAPLSRPGPLLTQNNQRLKKDGVWTWSLPAWAGRLPDGRTYNTCPSAGVCHQVCYALRGSYRWPVVLHRHEQNLQFVLDDPTAWETTMIAELHARKFRGQWIRLHDSGDFFSDAYLQAWTRICRAHPRVNFYTYTKEVARFRRLVEPDPPANLSWVFSFGGTQDSLIDPAEDRAADVFPDEDAITAAGWSSQRDSDLLAVLGPPLVGMAANRMSAARKLLQGRRFSTWQIAADAARAARKPDHRNGTRKR